MAWRKVGIRRRFAAGPASRPGVRVVPRMAAGCCLSSPNRPRAASRRAFPAAFGRGSAAASPPLAPAMGRTQLHPALAAPIVPARPTGPYA